VDTDEWVKKFSSATNARILKEHFDLQEKIKSHYKLRAEGKNLDKAITYCERQIALAPLTMRVMREKHNDDIEEGNKIRRDLGFSEVKVPFFAPSHHGYKQYSVILKRVNNLEKLAEIQAKKKSEGWA
jgi:hypothetical protein